MRAAFTSEIRAIESDMEAQLGQAVHALTGLDRALRHPARSSAGGFVAAGRELRQLSRRTDMRLVTLSATQAPVACDLRLVLTMMQICQHEGLIANQFVLIGEQLADCDPGLVEACATTEKVAELAQLACAQLDRARQAFAQLDPRQGEELRRSDDRLDRLNREVCRVSLEMRSGPALRGLAFRHVLIARSLERIGDNAVTIARHTADLVRSDVHHLAHPNDAPGLVALG